MKQSKETSKNKLADQEAAEKKVVSLWEKRYIKALNAQTPWFKKASQWYDLLYSFVKDEDQTWHSRVFEPIMTAKIWNLIAKTVAGNPGWLVTPSKEYDDVAVLHASAMEKVLAKFSNSPCLDPSLKEKLTVAILDATAAGIGYIKVPWTTEPYSKKERLIDEYNNIDTENIKTTTGMLGYPDAENISIFNVLFAPSTSNSIQKAPYLIIDSYQTKADLKAKGIYQNLNNLKQAPTSDTDSWSKSRNRMLEMDSESNDETLDMVLVSECYERIGGQRYVTVIGNRQQIIRPKRKLEYWHGKYPIVAFKIKPKAKSLVGESIFETNERAIWGINDLTNHFLDAWNMANNPMIMQEETTVVDSYEVAPGNVLTYRSNGNDKPQPFMMPQPPVRSYQGVRDTLAADIEQNSISGYQSGTPMDASDKTGGTKGGIMAIQQAGDDMLELYRGFFRIGVKELGVMWMQLIQQYLDREVWVKVSGLVDEMGNPIEALPVTPYDVQGEFELDLDVTSMIPKNKEVQVQKNEAFAKGVLEIFDRSQASPNPITINWKELISDYAEGYDKQGAEKYVTDAPPPAPPVDEGTEEPPEGVPPSIEDIDTAGLPREATGAMDMPPVPAGMDTTGLPV